MKIAIPVNENSINGNVNPSFGRAPYFLIYDTSSKASEFIQNPATSSSGGAGIKAAQTLVNEGVSALITNRVGENAAGVLSAAGISLYQPAGFSVADNTAAAEADKLSPLTDISAGMHSHRGGRN
jgi:predicted Fe-Mo cluster-binding NifX family protein